jgi:AcrR family transcriptional regulator
VAAHGRGITHHVMSEHVRRSAVGTQQCGQDPDRRRLSGAVGAEQREHGTTGDGEVELVQCARLTEEPGEPGGLYGKVFRYHPIDLTLCLAIWTVQMDNQVSRRTSGSDDTRLRLLNSAAELIAELGWGGVTTRAVADRAGLPHGAVSYHFRGKQDLLTEAALHTLEQAFPISELQALETLPDLLALFEPWLSEGGDNDPVVSRVGIEAMLESDRNPPLRERMADLLRQFREVVAELARTGQERGTAPTSASPEALAVLLGALGDGLFLHARLDPDLDARAALEALNALLSR